MSSRSPAGREQRRRSDEEAAACRAALVAQLDELERRRAAESRAPVVPQPREVEAPGSWPVRGRVARELLHLGRRRTS